MQLPSNHKTSDKNTPAVQRNLKGWRLQSESTHIFLGNSLHSWLDCKQGITWILQDIIWCFSKEELQNHSYLHLWAAILSVKMSMAVLLHCLLPRCLHLTSPEREHRTLTTGSSLSEWWALSQISQDLTQCIHSAERVTMHCWFYFHDSLYTEFWGRKQMHITCIYVTCGTRTKPFIAAVKYPTITFNNYWI